MNNIVNYNGITSSLWENIKATEVSDRIFEYILWKGEYGKQSAVYKFGGNTKFHMIDSHEKGEEHIYVISGVFNDGAKDYKEGSYIINPKGSAHIPQSKEGCVVLVTFPNGLV